MNKTTGGTASSGDIDGEALDDSVAQGAAESYGM